MSTNEAIDLDKNADDFLASVATLFVEKKNADKYGNEISLPTSLASVKHLAQTQNKVEDILLALQSRAALVWANVLEFGAAGDGVTNDTAAIQAAIDYVAGLGGGTVAIPAGTFVFTQLSVKANVRMLGCGGTLKLQDGVCTNPASSYYPINNIDGSSGFSNVRLENLIIDGNKANNTQFTVADAITVLGDNVEVLNCRITNPPDSGIMFSRVTNGIVSGCRISGATDLGIYVNDGLAGAVLNECVISDNRISGCVTGGIGLKRDSQRMTIANNQIYDCGNGITLEQVAGTDYSENVTIVGNRMRRIGQIDLVQAGRGIDLRRCQDVICIGNRIEDVVNQGIYLQAANGCVVQGNIVSHGGDGNVTNGNGIHAVDRDSIGCTRNTIIGNVIRTPTVRGIFLDTSTAGATGNLIANNQVISSTSEGARIGTGWNETNRFRGNILQGTARDFTSLAGAINIWDDNVYVSGMTTTTAVNVVHSTAFYALSAGWGSTASIAVTARSTDQRARVTVTSNGIGQAANPTITLTFPREYSNAPFAEVIQSGGSQPTVATTWTTSTTTLTITWNGTPVAAQTFTFDIRIMRG